MNTVPSTVRPERRHEVPESKDERKRESVVRLTEILSTIGYDITSPTHALTAFQRHFQPHKVDGVADQETYALLNGLLDAQKKLI